MARKLMTKTMVAEGDRPNRGQLGVGAARGQARLTLLATKVHGPGD